MSAALPQPHDFHAGDDADAAGDDRTVLVARPVVVRRNAGVAALIGGAASAIAIAYLWRAAQSGALVDWALCVAMALIAGFYLAGLVDARTPLVVADDLGVRIRLGRQWRGLPWEAVGRIVVQPRRGLLHDGRLTFDPHSLDRALDGLERRGRRQASLNQKMYGAALAVPVGLTTLVSRPDGERDAPLADRIAALARGRADVVVVRPDPAVEAPAAAPAAAPVDGDVREGRRSLVGNIGTIVSRVAKGRAHDVDVVLTDETRADDTPAAAPAALRETRRGLRAEVTRDAPATTLGATEGRELHRPGRVDLVIEAVDDSRVRPISQFGTAVEPLVIDDFVTEPARDPVIGPELAAARTRLGLSVDELAERTRIRPHVIESIEVDDFAPCGGDFYARGHLRTLARVLGKDPAAMVEQFDNRYATAPINARRVFEAELATGMTGSMRSTVGGPNWALLVGVVLGLVLVWGVVRLFATEPPQLVQSPTPVLDGSAGVGNGAPGPAADGGRPVRLVLLAPRTAARVVVRDADRRVVFAGRVRPGHRETLAVAPPVHVRADHASAVRVRVDGADRGRLGTTGGPGSRTLHRPAR